MSTTSYSSTSITVNTRELKDFAKVISHEIPEVGRRLRRQLRAAGEIVASDAREKAAAAMSAPPRIAVRVSGLRSVSVVARGPVITRLLEEGNKASSSMSSFHHPVYGNNVWVNQPMHPYLRPALWERGEEAVEAIAAAIDETVAAIALEHDVAA